MPINPKTLKAGDVVVFGGKPELIVRYVWTETVEFLTVVPTALPFHSIFWQIAELKPKPLPEMLGGIWIGAWELCNNAYLPKYHEKYSWREDGFCPENLLEHARSIVAELEASGVKVL